MNYKVIRSHQTTTWTGGTTTQLFIFPETADYQKRDFQFRLSTATVEIERSDFTPLPGFSRKLLVLDGEIILNHKDHYTAQLKKFDVDSFVGDWKTSCIGKCTDFNLIISGDTSTELKAICLGKEQNLHYKIKDHCNWFFVYVAKGDLGININHEKPTLSEGHLLVMEKPELKEIGIFGIENSELIFVEIFQ
jgi:environmental stress-induced protein Ves